MPKGIPKSGINKGWFKKNQNIGKNNPFYGKHHSKKTRQKMKEAKINYIPWNKGKIGLQKSTRKGKKRPEFSGKNHPRWKGGISPLNKLIKYSLEYKLWREAIFKRDNYTCQECFIKGKYLHPHHNIKSFAKIMQEFLQQYSQFSPIEDKETLARLAITYKSLWDVDNGLTLCVECHNLTRKKGGIKC